MKILVLSSFGEVCGVAAYTAALREALIAAGHAVNVSAIDGLALDRRARGDLPAHFEGFFARIPEHDAIVIQHEYALYAGIFGYEAACAVFAPLLARAARAGKPILVMFHTDPPGSPKVPPLAPVGRFRRNGWQRMAATINRSSHVSALAHTAAARRRMIEAGLDPGKVAVLSHPVPAVAPHGPAIPNTGDAEASVRLAIFGFVGRYKGYELALRSLLLLPPRYRLTVAGGVHPRDPNNTTPAAIRAFLETGHFPDGDLPPLPPQEAARVRERLAGRVAFMGHVPDESVRDVLCATDVVLLPYMAQGPVQSGAGAWALACRRPIVATDVETFADVVASRPCMHLVPPGSPEALAAGITRVAEDGALRQSLMHEAGLYAADNSWARAAEFVAGKLAAAVAIPARPRSLFDWSRRGARGDTAAGK